ncbi:CD44 antigen isoform X1 [Mixophyes fleayi]|uniref:CD44 antigen isoform X1 n=1 Tax=Mixophyes fleayi TaxID=3061075 RepID=UPI003F4DCAA0
MTKLLWIFSLGLCCWISLSQATIVISCRFQGVFHVEKDTRYNLIYEEAGRACTDIDAIIATKEQVETAYEVGFETCRYGWVDNSTVLIPRITKNPKCAANYIGIYVLNSNLTNKYDVYCFNASETSDKNCDQYDYRNKSVPSYDPTEEEEGPLDGTESSKVSVTHPGHGNTTTEQGKDWEDCTTDPLPFTEQPEHSGDRVEDPYDSTRKNLLDDRTADQEGLIPVTTPNPEDDFQRTAEAPVHQDSGTKHEPTHVDVSDEKKNRNEDLDNNTTVDGSAEGSSDSNKTNVQRRAAIPEWLIVCVSLVCLGLIFSVCIALNAGRICGHKRKLVINGNKGSLEDGVIMEQNGDTIKSQEMVQLVSQDQSDNPGGNAMTQEDKRNARDVDMKIGV